MVVVVMRVTTLKVPAAKVGRLLAYYAGLAEDPERPGPARGPVDYYLDPDEPPGRWWGDGCAALGLAGPVDGADLRSLLEAEDPRTGDRLGRRFGNASARGFDATFSAPKSVSVLWALSPDPWVRAEVLAAHDAAVDAAMGWFQRHGAVTRRGTDGLFQVDTLGVTAALFRQHTSRTVDPQLHTHAVISSKVQDESGGWFALDARFLKRQQRTIGWIYDAALRGELTARLGVEWREHDGMVEDLACISADLRDGFSKRSNQVAEKHSELIRRWSASHDGADPDTRTIASLERDAAKKSRPDKEHGIDAAVLRAEWVDEARRLGHDPEHLIAKAITFQGWPDGRVHDEDLIDEALLHASDEASTWLRADLARHLATIIEPYRCPTAVAVVEEIDRLATLAEKRCTALGPERNDTSRHRRDGRPLTEHVTDRRFTNPGVFRQEEELQAWAASHTRPVGSTADPQRAAALAIAGHDQLVVVVGPAGTGKTHTTAVAVGVLQARGRPVVGLAPSGKAADVLATEAHCPTDTVAGFLTRNRGRPTPWPAGTTVLLDEAGMAATADLARLVDLVRLNRWRLVAVGDPEQLASVARGGVFAHWCDTLPHHALDTPRRFAHDWEAAASLGLRAGRPDAVAAYAQHRRLQVAHPALVATQVARAHQNHEAAGRTMAITTNTAETARAINREIQWLRHPRPADGVELHDGTSVHVGDAIATRRNDPTARTDQGEKVRNRQTWTVAATHADGAITARHDERGSVVLQADYVARHVELGWAVTGYGNQGDTVDIGIAVLEGSASRNHAYVAMTRGRQANHALVVDADDTTDPADRLTDIITRPSTVESALAVQARLHREAGIEPSADQRRVQRPSRPETSPPEPSPQSEADRLHQEKVDAARARLDRAQHRLTHSSPDRGLGL
jgi:conjugative relaxase-like TrwC/TraI family protein